MPQLMRSAYPTLLLLRFFHAGSGMAWHTMVRMVATTLPLLTAEDFLGFRYVQFEIILCRPSCNVISLCGLFADVGSGDDH